MKKRILITGGAGFIGSHLADELIAGGYSVRALDNLSCQVHGKEARRPDYLNPEVELIIGDVRDPAAVLKALRGMEAVFHLAACVGVGQSMYEIEKYTSTNNLGTAVLLEALIKNPVERLVVASSMSVYGEGLYRTAGGTVCHVPDRTIEQLKRGRWEISGPDGEIMEPVPTPEWKPPSLASVYALSKYHQERTCFLIGRAYGISTVALRFFNVFGSRQALSNPYTGVLAIFASRILNGNPPLIYEDGGQRRDFVSVHDVAKACLLALEVPGASGMVFNIGSGRSRTIGSIAESMASLLGMDSLKPFITHKYRVGDIRHCFADISLAADVLGYRPEVEFEQGLVELAAWLERQEPADLFSKATTELAARRLTV
ncbi:MAG: NAD-dependent epimerase/dehydratase family protein [Syntrophales bacterium]